MTLPQKRPAESKEAPTKRRKAPPTLSQEELNVLVLDAARIAGGEVDLRRHMEEHGVAIIHGVASPAQAARLQEFARGDLQALLTSAPAEKLPSPNFCQGFKKNGERCRLHSETTGPGMANRCLPLRMGAKFCKLHLAESAEHEEAGKDFEHRVELSEWNTTAIRSLGLKGRLHARGLPQGKFAWACLLLPGVREIFQSLYPGEELVVGLDMPFFTAADQPVTTLHPGAHVDQNTNIVSGRRYQSILYAWPADENSSCACRKSPRSLRQPSAGQ